MVWYHAGYCVQVSDTRGMISRWVLPTSLRYPWYDITLGIAYKSQLPVGYHTGYNLEVSATRGMISRWVLPKSLRYPWYDITLAIAYRSQLPVVWYHAATTTTATTTGHLARLACRTLSAYKFFYSLVYIFPRQRCEYAQARQSSDLQCCCDCNVTAVCPLASRERLSRLLLLFFDVGGQLCFLTFLFWRCSSSPPTHRYSTLHYTTHTHTHTTTQTDRQTHTHTR